MTDTTTPHRPLAMLVGTLAFTAGLVLVASGCGAQDGARQSPAEWTYLTSAADSDLELIGGSEIDGSVLILDGASGLATAPVPESFDTTRSFTVSAWVATGDGSAPFQSALSQRGEVAGAFYLGVADGRFAFSMKDADSNEEGHTFRAVGDRSPSADDQWVHLAGVFDADAGTIALFIDGSEVASTEFDAPIGVDGPLTIGGAQAHGANSDFWSGAVTEVTITAAAASAVDLSTAMATSRPSSAPPVAPVESATYADGVLDGTWDYVYTDDEAAFLADVLGPGAMSEIGDLTASRLGFDGPKWWQGFVGDGEVWTVGGVPEGDAGTFSVYDGVLTTDNGSAVVTYDWTLDGDSLSLVILDCRTARGTCEDIEMVRFMTERSWTRSGTDGSF